MKIKSVTHNARKATVYDFETPSNAYVLGNGLISHNTMEMFSKAVMSGGCVVENTKIIMSDGTEKNIQDVVEGEYVKTLIGDKLIKHTWSPDTLEVGEPECFEVSFEDGSTVTCSENHRFLVGGEWVEIKNIEINSYVTDISSLNPQTNDSGVMKVTGIVAVGKKKVYDISVEDAEHYFLSNGVASHNTGGMYSANQVFIIGKAQEKSTSGDKELLGYNFTINIEKSRFVKEKSKFPFLVTFDGGIQKYSGLLELATEANMISVGKYSRSTGYAVIDQDTGEVGDMMPLSKTQNAEFWNPILNNKKFKAHIKNKYGIAHGSLLQDDNEESESQLLQEDNA